MDVSHIELTPRASSNVRATGYDSDSEVLVVEFADGARYSYEHVPADVAAGIDSAESVGKYLHANVFGLFPSTKLART